MKKHLPKFKTDKDVEAFLGKDISEYLSRDNLKPITFEFAAKSKVVNLRMSKELLGAVKASSKKRGMPYQRYIREALEFYIKKDQV